MTLFIIIANLKNVINSVKVYMGIIPPMEFAYFHPVAIAIGIVPQKKGFFTIMASRLSFIPNYPHPDQ
ncbi:hypothetical protein Hanom_Chr15g01413941 [Helianthus anomalus]